MGQTDRQRDRQTCEAVIQSFTQSITQAVSQSFWQSVIQWRCVLYNKSEMCTARPETKLHSIKKSCRGAQININSMNINCHCCTLCLLVCVRARVCGAGDGRQMDRSTFTLAAMATGTAMMMIPTDCQLTHMPQKVTHTHTRIEKNTCTIHAHIQTHTDAHQQWAALCTVHKRISF